MGSDRKQLEKKEIINTESALKRELGRDPKSGRVKAEEEGKKKKMVQVSQPSYTVPIYIHIHSVQAQPNSVPARYYFSRKVGETQENYSDRNYIYLLYIGPLESKLKKQQPGGVYMFSSPSLSRTFSMEIYLFQKKKGKDGSPFRTDKSVREGRGIKGNESDSFY